jgi:hypothetical protein
MSTGNPIDKEEKIVKFVEDVIYYIAGTPSGYTGTTQTGIIEKDSADVTYSADAEIRNYDSANTGVTVSRHTPVISKSSLRTIPGNFSSLGTQSAVVNRGNLIEASALVDMFMVYGRSLTSVRQCSATILKVNTAGTSSVTTGGTQVVLKCGESSYSQYCTGKGTADGYSTDDPVANNEDVIWFADGAGQDGYEANSSGKAYYIQGGTTTPGTRGEVAVNTLSLWTDQVTALSQDYMLPAADFKAAVEVSPNPLEGLTLNATAAAAAIDDLIERIKDVIEINAHANALADPIEIVACHASCHSSCHGSRGRR